MFIVINPLVTSWRGFSSLVVSLLNRRLHIREAKTVITSKILETSPSIFGYMCNLLHAICCRGAKIIVQLF